VAALIFESLKNINFKGAIVICALFHSFFRLRRSRNKKGAVLRLCRNEKIFVVPHRQPLAFFVSLKKVTFFASFPLPALLFGLFCYLFAASFSLR